MLLNQINKGKFYFILFISLALILNEINSLPFAPKSNQLKGLHKNSRTIKFKRSDHIDQADKCILACVACSGEDLDDNNEQEPEQSRSLTCSNDCLVSSGPDDMILSLLDQDLFDKTFAKCFLHHFENPILE